MQKCWKADPTERPIFANLTAIFDGMLQQRTVRVVLLFDIRLCITHFLK